MSEENPLEGEALLYGLFEPLKVLGKGGMGRVLKVRVDRDSQLYNKFLASVISWHESITNPHLMPLRLQAMALNRDIHNLYEKESHFMHVGEITRARQVIQKIEGIQKELNSKVKTLKRDQEYYVNKRGSQLADIESDKMIEHLVKAGLPYPEEDIFAMKQMLSNDKEYKARLQDEFKSLKLAQHTNILSVYTMGKDYYIMEFIDNVIDPEVIAPTDPNKYQMFTNEDRIRIVIDTAKAVENVHLFGIIHRDIKPRNIAVDENKNVKLIDFGLVKSLETHGVTTSSAVVGTPHFMCPEQIESSAHATTLFDVYGLGATLYYFITGTMPYSEISHVTTRERVTPKTIHEMFVAVVDPLYEPVRPSEYASGVPASLESIINKAMAHNSNHRYQTVKEFREDLERFLEIADEKSLKLGSYYEINPVEVQLNVRSRTTPETDASKQNTIRSSTPNLNPLIKYIVAAFILLILIILFKEFNVGSRIIHLYKVYMLDEKPDK